MQRATLDQLDRALAGVAQGQVRGVHEARKACKRARALLRLMRPGLGAAYRTENLRLRDAGRALASQRDADVLRATARSLGMGMTVNPPASGSSAAAVRRAVKLLHAQCAATGRWPPDALAREDLDAALAEGYRRARRGGQQARRDRRPETLHEWRKQVKHHRYQCEAASSLWPALLRRGRALDVLAEALGRHHDLEVLAQQFRLRPHRFGEPDLVLRAAQRVSREQARVAARALRAVPKLFDQHPRQWLGHETAR